MEALCCFSKEFVIALSEHVGCIEIMDSFALNPLPVFVYVFIIRIYSLQVGCLGGLRVWKIVSFKQFSGGFFRIFEFNGPGGWSGFKIIIFEFKGFLFNGPNNGGMLDSLIN